MRRPRITQVGGIYHIVTRTVNKEFLFKDDSDFQLLYNVIKKAKEKHKVKLYSYSMTHNHTHLCVHTPEQDNISEFMRDVNGQFAQQYNRKHNRCGHFWGGRYSSNLIESDSHFLNTLFYLDLQMIRAGVVADPRHWSRSSYSYYAYGEKDPIVDLHPDYTKFANNPQKRQLTYRSMVKQKIKEKSLLQKRKIITQGIITGSYEFVETAQKQTKHNCYHDRKIHLYEGIYTSYRIGKPVG